MYAAKLYSADYCLAQVFSWALGHIFRWWLSKACKPIDKAHLNTLNRSFRFAKQSDIYTL